MHQIKRILSLALHSFRLSVWVIMAKFRRLFQFFFWIVIIGGLSMIGLTVFNWVFVGIDHPTTQYPVLLKVLNIIYGIIFVNIGALATVFYDKILFKLEPKDRTTIYH